MLFSPPAIPAAIQFFSLFPYNSVSQVEKTEGEGEEEAAEKAGGSKEGEQRERKHIRRR